MVKKHNCLNCNYSTDILSNYKKHLNTRKHKLAISEKESIFDSVGSKIDSLESKNDQKSILKCAYCDKLVSTKRNLSRHYKTCTKKQVLDVEKSKDKIINKLLIENNQCKQQKEELERLNKKVVKEKQKLEKEYFDFIKDVASSKNSKIDINQTNYNMYNMYYVANHFKDAHNIEDLMAPALTVEEKSFIENNGPIVGCHKLIKDRCIDGIDIDKRPLHCVDTSRNKFMLRTNDDWIIDQQGKIILDTTSDKIKKLYTLDNTSTQNLEKLIELHSKKDRSKIINYLSSKTMLKNSL